MLELGRNAGYIFAAYVITLLVMLGLFAWILIDGRRQRRQLRDLEARGIRRRSARAPGSSGEIRHE